MIRKFVAAIAGLCISAGGGINAQSNEQKYNNAEEIYAKVYLAGETGTEGHAKAGYEEARTIFLELYRLDTTNANLAYKLGICYLASRRYVSEASGYLEKASRSVSEDYDGGSYKEKRAPLVAYRYLGDALHSSYQFSRAISAYEKYLEVVARSAKINTNQITEVNRRIEMCKTGQRLMASPVKVTIKNLGPEVNSSFADYAPVLSADQQSLFFTTRRPVNKTERKDKDGNVMEDIFMSSKTKSGWSEAKSIGSPINTLGNESAIAVSPDGQEILIYKDDAGDGNIYKTTLDGDTWTKPTKLNGNINSTHWEPSAVMSADGQLLYFVSDRPDGFGGRDLYVSRLTSDGDWGKATNLGANINTVYDEDAPFIHADGRTLSFSSNGHNTMGGFDIFTSLISEDGSWSAPVNAGYPLNTTEDDVFYVVSPDSRNAFFTSFREGGFGEKDNYLVTYVDKKKTPLTLVKGTVTNISGMRPGIVSITVTDNETEQVTGNYHTNSKTGQFLFILTPGKNYNITYQTPGHLFYSENIEIPKESNYYEINKALAFSPIVVGSRIVLNNIFFDFDKSTLRSLSNVELRNLVTLLRTNPNMNVEISGHTDGKGTAAYNQKLSVERSKAVVDRLAQNGIDASRMSARGYGKIRPVAANKKGNGKDDPEGRQLNRRVELRITEIK